MQYARTSTSAAMSASCSAGGASLRKSSAEYTPSAAACTAGFLCSCARGDSGSALGDSSCRASLSYSSYCCHCSSR
jgi:hypothetical protein